MSITSAANKPAEFGKLLEQKLGIKQIEIINNEVIASGVSLSDPNVTVLVHSRVDPPNLSFTVRSQAGPAAMSLI